MALQRWFYRNTQEWLAFVERLKLIPCPHCMVVGALIRHGSLYGFDDRSPCHNTLRARRIFCSNRNARPGCGRTFSVWVADIIRRLSLTTSTLWRFLQRAVAHGIAAASSSNCQRSDRTWQRIWRRFNLGQCQIRTALLGRCQPPELPAEHRPAAQVLAHLEAAFPGANCPIATFQHTFRTFFL